jgi:hypothetical protein
VEGMSEGGGVRGEKGGDRKAYVRKRRRYRYAWS